MVKVQTSDYVVFIVALVVFVCFFFFVPPKPVYWEPDGIHPPPRDVMPLENGSYIIGHERPMIVIIAPVICLFSMVIIGFGGRMKRIRDLNIKNNIKETIINKMKEGKRLHVEWRKRK